MCLGVVVGVSWCIEKHPLFEELHLNLVDAYRNTPACIDPLALASCASRYPFKFCFLFFLFDQYDQYKRESEEKTSELTVTVASISIGKTKVYYYNICTNT